MSGFISYPYAVSVVSVITAVGGELLAGETDAMGIDFTYHDDIGKQLYISDLTTPANNYNSYPAGKLTYTSPSLKMTRQSDGIYRYVNHNLFLRSQELTNANWVAQNFTGATNTGDTTAPDGTSTAEKFTCDNIGATNHQIYQVMLVFSGARVAESIFAKQGTGRYFTVSIGDGGGNYGSGTFDLQAGTVTQSTAGGGVTSSATISNAGNGWYRLTVTTNPNAIASWFCIFTSSGVGTPSVDAYGRDAGHNAVSSETYYLWGAQFKRYPVNDAPGYTYATGYLATTTAAVYDLPYEWSAALASQGILIEEARTNLIQRSQELDNAYWFDDSTSQTANAATAPDGTATAEKLLGDTNNSTHTMYTSPGNTNGVTYTWSIFAKAAEMTWLVLIENVSTTATNSETYFNLSNGTVGTTDSSHTAQISDAGNGWYRCSVTYAAGGTGSELLFIGLASGDNGKVFAGSTSNGIYIWGAQLEVGAFPTSPIHTIGATVTRAVDNITLATSLIPLSTTAHTIYAKVNVTANMSGTRYFLGLDNGGTSEMFVLINQSGTAGNFIIDGAVTQAQDNVAAAVVVGTDYRLASSLKLNDAAVCGNGGTVVQDSTATLPTPTVLGIGLRSDSPSLSLQPGYYKHIVYLKRDMSNSELQTRTT